MNKVHLFYIYSLTACLVRFTNKKKQLTHHWAKCNSTNPSVGLIVNSQLLTAAMRRCEIK